MTPVRVKVPELPLTREPAPLTTPESVWLAVLLNFSVPVLAMFLS